MADNSTAGSLTKSVTHTIEWDGNKHAWKFNTDSVETWAGIELVKLDPKNSSLLGFIINDAAILKSFRSSGKRVSSLPGYRALMDLRNEAQAAQLTAQVDENPPAQQCTVFASTASVRAAPKRKPPKKALAANEDVISVNIVVGGATASVVMKPPIGIREALQIEYSLEAIELVVTFIREYGFTPVDV